MIRNGEAARVLAAQDHIRRATDELEARQALRMAMAADLSQGFVPVSQMAPG